MFHKDKPKATPESYPPLSDYDRWMSEEAGHPPPEDTPTDPSIRAEENAEYARNVQ